ncbi:15113_t:CDS:1, partial [Acaulospora morrowiae]
SMTSIGLQTSPHQLDPPGGLGLGTSSGSISSSSTMSSISKSLTHHPNVPSRLSEKVSIDRSKEDRPQPVRIPQTKTSEFRPHRSRRSSSITSNSSIGKGNDVNLMQSDNLIMDTYSNLASQVNAHYHNQEKHNLLFKESNSSIGDSITNPEGSNNIMDGLGKSSATGYNIKKTSELVKEFDHENIAVTGHLTGRADIISGSPVHQVKVGASNNDDDELLFTMTLSEPNIQKNVSSVNDFHDQNLNCYHSVPLDRQSKVTVEASVEVDGVDNSNQINMVPPS